MPHAAIARRAAAIALLLPCAPALGQTREDAPAPGEALPASPTVVVEPRHEEMGGEVFRVIAPESEDPQVAVVSDAPLDEFVGEADAAGYAVVGGLHALKAFVVRVPVASIDTGIPLRNEHLRGERWLHEAEHPEITYTLAEARDIEEVRAGGRFTTYTAVFVGDMTIAGVTREVLAPATIVFMPECDYTLDIAPGDLLAVRTVFHVDLDAFGVAKGDPALRSGAVARDIRVQARLLLSDDEAFAPAEATSD